MSDFNSSLGTFNPNDYKNNGTGTKPKQRMAGEYMSDFVNANANDKKDEQKDFTYQGSDGKDYGTNTEKMLFGNSPMSSKKEVSSPTSSKKEVSSQPVGESTPVKSPSNENSSGQQSSFTLAPPKSGEKYYANKAEVKAAWNGKYDEDEYRYYKGKDGLSTGADAYHTDMANYQAQMASMGDNPHLGLVNSMMHPDWKDHNYNGTYGKVQESPSYSVKPDDWDNMQKIREALKAQMKGL